MYLILDPTAASARNIAEALKKEYEYPTVKRWNEIELADGNVALNVEDGDGLTESELATCVNELPMTEE